MSAVLSSSRADVIAFVADAYEGIEVRPGKGMPHAQAVAEILRRAGYDEATQRVGLLHDVVEDTPRTLDDVRDAFGEPTATMVGAVTEDTAIRHYAQRKRDLRARTVAAGSPAVEVAVADKIATLRDALLTERRVTDRKLRHYAAMLQLALAAGLATDLCRQLDELLARAHAPTG